VAVLLVKTPHDQELADPSGASPGHHRLPVSIELRHVDVTVTVNKARYLIRHDLSSYLHLFSD
jgi:hypothetical protein